MQLLLKQVWIDGQMQDNPPIPVTHTEHGSDEKTYYTENIIMTTANIPPSSFTSTKHSSNIRALMLNPEIYRLTIKLHIHLVHGTKNRIRVVMMFLPFY